MNNPTSNPQNTPVKDQNVQVSAAQPTGAHLMEAADHFSLNFPQIIELGMKVWAAVQAVLGGGPAIQTIKGLKFLGKKWKLTLKLEPDN